MRWLRLWLLCVLAVLLPVQQAAAAAMLCPPIAAGHALASDHAEAMPPHCAAMAAATGGHDRSPTHTHDAGPCGVCAAFGALSSLPSVDPRVMPLRAAGSAFPALVPPAVQFVTGAQERPPRHC